MPELLRVAPLVINLLSLAASTTLLAWVSMIKRTMAGKLMPRQLWHLALADVFVSLLRCPRTVLDVLHPGPAEPTELLSKVCFVAMCVNLPFMTSVLIEVHIALATVFAIFRLSRALRFISSVFLLVWPLGLIGGCLLMVLSGPYWNTDQGACDSRKPTGQDARGLFLTVALGICVATYIAGICKSTRGAAGSVSARIWRKARWFVAAAVISWSPSVVVAYTNSGDSEYDNVSNVEYYVTFGFLCLNGMLNAATYALQSHLVRQMQRRARTVDLYQAQADAGQPCSLTGPLSLNGPLSLTGHSDGSPRAVASYHVGFKSEPDLSLVTAQGGSPAPDRSAFLSPRAIGALDVEPESFIEDKSPDDDFWGCFDHNIRPAVDLRGDAY